jgi:hypothetical protein
MKSSAFEGNWPRVLLRGGNGTERDTSLSVSLDDKSIENVEILELQIELEKRKLIAEQEKQATEKEKQVTADKKILAEKERANSEKEKQKTLQLKAERVQDNNAELISFGQLLDSPMPPIDDRSICVSAKSEEQLRLIPTEVRSWENFKEVLIHHRESIPTELLSGHCRSLRRPVAKGRIITVKLGADIFSAFSTTICDALDQLFDGEMKTTSFSASGLVAVKGKEYPDFVTATKRMAPAQHVGASSGDSEMLPAGIQFGGATGSGGAVEAMTTNPESVHPVTVTEIKRDNLIMYGRDLVALYSSKRIIQDAIDQITGYHVVCKCKYGFISCYMYTWATYLDEDGVLYISPCFVSDTIGELSTLNMMYFVNRKACDELRSRSHMWTPPMFLKARSDPPSKKRAAHNENEEIKALQELSLSGAAPTQKKRNKPQGSKFIQGHCTKYTLLQVMSNVTDRITWKAAAGKYRDTYVVIKCYSAEEDRDSEVECYNLLKDLQGSSIPVLLDPSLTIDEEEQGRSHGLVISWVGSEHGGSYRMLPTDALQDARRIVVAMHKLGVSHRDIRPLNMNYCFRTKKLYLLDFSRAETENAIGQDAFQQACFEDLFEIDRLIRISKTKSAQEMRYYHWPDCGLQGTFEAMKGVR